jgi:hypothetical protein
MSGLLQAVRSAVGRKAIVASGLVVGLAASPAFAQASGVDYTGLTTQVDFSSTITAIMAVAGSLVLLYVAIKGSKIVLRMIRGA